MDYEIIPALKEPLVCDHIPCEHGDCPRTREYFTQPCIVCHKALTPGQQYYRTDRGQILHTYCAPRRNPG